MTTTEINVFEEDSPICSLARARLLRLARHFSWETKGEIESLLEELKVLGIGVEVDENLKSVKIFFQLG